MSYDSQPRKREGELIEEVLPQAIETTASRKREKEGSGSRFSPALPLLVLSALCALLTVLLILALVL